jgi:cyclase
LMPLHDLLTRRLDTGKGADGKPMSDAEKNSASAKLKMVDRFIDNANGFVYQPPTLMFEQELSVDMGAGREVQVRFLGRANTGGDAIVYLPKEKVLITGDVVGYPVPFAYDGYPSEWIQTLHKMTELDVETIVPGHGSILHDKRFLDQTAGLMKAIVDLVDQQFRSNPDVTLEEVRKSIDLTSYRQTFAGNDDSDKSLFDSSIQDSFVSLAYNERKQR